MEGVGENNENKENNITFYDFYLQQKNCYLNFYAETNSLTFLNTGRIIPSKNNMFHGKKFFRGRFNKKLKTRYYKRIYPSRSFAGEELQEPQNSTFNRLK